MYTKPCGRVKPLKGFYKSLQVVYFRKILKALFKKFSSQMIYFIVCDDISDTNSADEPF